jgi:methylmalonyl-CoA/ethylmalonyl-CoA epimerase
MTERVLDHIGVAVPDLDAALPTWERIVGAAAYGRERVESQGVEVVFVGEGAGRIELLAPIDEASTVAKFLARRGAGTHHLCYRVPDLAAALAAFLADGYEAIDREPRAGAHGHRVAFLHPRSTSGVLIELLEAAS